MNACNVPNMPRTIQQHHGKNFRDLVKKLRIFIDIMHGILFHFFFINARNVKGDVNKRPTGLNGHLSIRDFTMTSFQKGSYLYINSPIIE